MVISLVWRLGSPAPDFTVIIYMCCMSCCSGISYVSRRQGVWLRDWSSMFVLRKVSNTHLSTFRATILVLLLRRSSSFSRPGCTWSGLRATSTVAFGNMLFPCCLRQHLMVSRARFSVLSMAWDRDYGRRRPRGDDDEQKDRGFSKPPRQVGASEGYQDGKARRGRKFHSEDDSPRRTWHEGMRDDSTRSRGRWDGGRIDTGAGREGGFRRRYRGSERDVDDDFGKGSRDRPVRDFSRGRQGSQGRTDRGFRQNGFDDHPGTSRQRAWPNSGKKKRGSSREWDQGRALENHDDVLPDAEHMSQEDPSQGSSGASTWIKGELLEYNGELTPSVGNDDDRDVDMLYGIAPVLNAMRNSRREKLTLYCQDGLAPANKKDKAAAGAIYDLARETGVPMTTMDKGYLNTLCGNRPHQGFVLKSRRLDFQPLLFLPALKQDQAHVHDRGDDADGRDDGIDASGAHGTLAPLRAERGHVWLALDEVTDPQNFGALLRSAHFFGASGVVTCAKNSASLTPTVSKASAGAAEVMRVHSTSNMMRFLRRSRENGWRVVGTCISERAVTLHELPAGPDAPPTIIVLGNEGYGVRANVLRECDVLVEVAGEGGGALAVGSTDSTVDSLNVSVTGGVVLFHLLASAKYAAAITAVVGRPEPASIAEPP